MSRVASSLRLTTARRTTRTDETLLSSSQLAKPELTTRQAPPTAFCNPASDSQPSPCCFPTTNPLGAAEPQHQVSSKRSSFSEPKAFKALHNRVLLRERPLFIKIPHNQLSSSTTEDAGESSHHFGSTQSPSCRVDIQSVSKGGPEISNRAVFDASDARSSKDAMSHLQRQHATSKFCSTRTHELDHQQSKLNEILNRPIPRPISLSDEEMRSIISQTLPLKSILKQRKAQDFEIRASEELLPERSVMSAGRATGPEFSACKKVTFSRNKIVKIFRQQLSSCYTRPNAERDDASLDHAERT